MQARRRVDDVAHRRVVGSGDRADEDLAGVDPDAHADVVDRVGVVDVVVLLSRVFGDETGERLLHPQGGAHGSVGVVLVGDRSPEEGDDRVAEDLVDTAAERLDLGHQGLEVRLDEAGDRLRVAVLGERGVADEVGEQHRDDAAFLDGDRRVLRGSPARRTET